MIFIPTAKPPAIKGRPQAAFYDRQHASLAAWRAIETPGITCAADRNLAICAAIRRASPRVNKHRHPQLISDKCERVAGAINKGSDRQEQSDKARMAEHLKMLKLKRREAAE
jgi:hypothetical protein